jgi:hypothetical protein
MTPDHGSRKTVPGQIIDLVERFDRNRDSYHSAGYNEMQLRLKFLNPFFSALGWDVEDKQGYAPAYWEVIYEDSLRVGGETKAPGYCFRIGGMLAAALTRRREETMLTMQTRGET